ncbi:MAG: NAD(P)-dependent oxidoreductase [Devosia sp.]|uniref:NAD(P)-dependent oxidoreductase n=1 Tax=Devosia sp. TaxID=1871048 RepID=UPI001A45A851|nr:NAD(P)-dependent oxidoreductase [Devosia sp.]MBL8597338.1 NAD(P)-dependent oxidoreductase [Devosia sp.]
MAGKKIGFVGLGAMGRGLAGNLLRKGFDVTVWDLAPAAVDALVAKGAKRAANVAELARAVDVICTMVPDAPDVKRVALGEDGIIAGAHPGLIYVDFSTVDPTTSRAVGAALAEKGIRMLDSPVGRGVPEAEAGTVTFMVGGDTATLEEVRPILEAMSSEIMHIGDLGAGTTIKLVNNYLAAGMVAIIAEAISFGIKSGVTLEQIIALSDKTGTSNKVLNTVLPRKVFKADYTPGFASRLAAKDHRLAMSLARDLDIDLPVGKVILDILQTCETEFRDEDFMGSIMRLAERESGQQLRLQGN